MQIQAGAGRGRVQQLVTVIGSGSIGRAIACRISAGKHLLLADLRPVNAAAAATVLEDAGLEVSTTTVDVASRDSVRELVGMATCVGDVTSVITPLARDELDGPRGEDHHPQG
jgi:saccharopine dehydrogenase-like NADP-dependent oxidoreductase